MRREIWTPRRTPQGADRHFAPTRIGQVGPGACPICGMALEPEIATAASGETAELTDMRRRFWISPHWRSRCLRWKWVGTSQELMRCWPKAGRIGFSSFWQPRFCSGAAGPSSFERDSLCSPAPQHVHPHRDGHWDSVALQRHCNLLPRFFRRASAARTALSLSISKRLP